MKIDFLGIPVDALTMQETLGKIDQAIKNDQKMIKNLFQKNK